MAIAFRSVSTLASASATQLDVSQPSGLADSDVLVAFLSSDGTPTLGAPGDWTAAHAEVGGTTKRQRTWYRAVTSAAGEPATYAFTASVANPVVCTIVAYSGVDNTTPMDATATVSDNNVADLNVTATSITTVTDNAIVVWAGMIDSSTFTCTEPASTTQRIQTTTNRRMTVADFVQATAGATGSKVGSISTARESVGVHVALRPFTAPAGQTAAPDGDIATGTWTTDTGATATFAAIDEATASDADYDQSSLNPVTTDTFRVSLADVSDPAVSTGHVVKYRYGKDVAGGDAMTLVVRLMQGATQIAAWTHTDVPAGFTTAAQTLSGTEADNITDYTNLDLVFEATKG